ncbi:tetratricopeptide repeat protein [Uliginosibacterium sp. 31-16]|uniref:tetratricopeptide repeat protein n=1 Tax=Uliginosibacterium sp. 31-16 TaxID=3068315 RepID=UPI00273F3BE6|nr:tetratricopeptide repeat protein [Uliginosibacterium sp. 31-16]MDP5240083.1 tetratricopeptide repeat protein [Uliginosibacterium sp. 31-16]
MTTTPSPSDDTSEVTVTQALAYAVQLQQANQLDAAELLYTRILEALPEQPDALHFLGVLQHQRGHSDTAIALIAQACTLIPNHPDCHINLGNVLADTGRLPEASTAYRRALELDPERSDVFNNLGVVFKMLGRWEEAEASYLRAIEISPDGTSAYNNLGLLHATRGRIKEAIHYYCLSIAKMPGHPDARRLLGIAYYTLGRTREAAEVFRQWREAEPDSPVARHMHAACSGEDVPERAADDYVEQTFDRFADSFDKQLQLNLAYRAPELVAEALARALPAGAAPLDILDAGCGTGLCGPLLRPLARRLSGADLSGGMLAKAEARQCYDLLLKEELTAFMAARPASFDAIISADTLVYFGALEAVCTAARQALRPQGLFVFTVEQLPPGTDQTGFRINPHGRYAHGRDYLESSLLAAGFSVRSIEAADLRNEGGEPVTGWVVTAAAP